MKNRSFLIFAAIILVAALILILRSPLIKRTSPSGDESEVTKIESQESGGLSDRKFSSSPSTPVMLEENFDASLYTTVSNHGGRVASPERLFLRVPSTSSRLMLLPNSQVLRTTLISGRVSKLTSGDFGWISTL